MSFPTYSGTGRFHPEHWKSRTVKTTGVSTCPLHGLFLSPINQFKVILNRLPTHDHASFFLSFFFFVNGVYSHLAIIKIHFMIIGVYI
jgi:hypothetical protein